MSTVPIRAGLQICPGKDLERRRVVDLLPDRSGETLAAWLRQHGKGVAVVGRDRTGAYAAGIRAGAPRAVQIADRWHLMVNASDAPRQVLDRHAASGAKPPGCACRPPARRNRRQPGNRPRRQANGDARRLGMARNTVRRWLRAGEAPV